VKRSRLLAKEPSILVRPKSVTRTFRVDDDIDLAFKTLALREDVSVNQLVTKALRRYIEWENLVDKVGLVEFHEKSLELLFDSISDERARELGRDTGMNAWMDMVTFLLQGFNYTTILKMLELRGRYGRWFIFDKSSENGVDTIILKHRQGRRVSAFLSEAVKALLERTNLKFELVEMEHQVLFRVHPNRKREPQGPSPVLAESPLPQIRVNRLSPTRRSAELGEKPEPL
jgi:hypothetical protein